MIEKFRSEYNQKFTQSAYKSMCDWVDKVAGEACTFRLCETPVFIPDDLKKHLLDACQEITAQISQPDIKAKTAAAVPKHLDVPNENDHSLFLQLDFGICEDAAGNLLPQLIEMQGFPSLYFFQHALAGAFMHHFDVPKQMTPLQSGLDEWAYIDLMYEVIVGDCKPEEVVLLEIEPRKQNTRIDFWLTKAYLGIKILCLSEVVKEGKQLFYEDAAGEKIRIKRIYNRIIFDELDRHKDLPRQWNLVEPVDVEWVGHPNWFLRLSKYTLPFIKSKYVPETHFLDTLESYPYDLENWVLKPIFSFSGAGVLMDIGTADLDAITDRENYILQRKMPYKPVVNAPGEKVKCEVRMMFVWMEDWEKPLLVNNLIRMSKGKMVGVKYNKDKDWVGASVGFFER